MGTLKEKIDTAINNNEDISEDYRVGKDTFDVNYDAEWKELVISAHYIGKPHSDDDDLVTDEDDGWNGYEDWSWPKGEPHQIV